MAHVVPAEEVRSTATRMRREGVMTSNADPEFKGTFRSGLGLKSSYFSGSYVSGWWHGSNRRSGMTSLTFANFNLSRFLPAVANSVFAFLFGPTEVEVGNGAEQEEGMEPEPPGTVVRKSHVVQAQEIRTTPTRIRAETVMLPANANPLLDWSRGCDRSRCSGNRFRITVDKVPIPAHLHIVVKEQVLGALTKQGAISATQKVAIA